MPGSLDKLLRHPGLWRGTRHPSLPAGLPTGFPELDAILPGHGWPRGALTRIRMPESGAGMGLLLPLLARLTQAGETVALVSPPAIPHAPGWAQAGLDLRHLLVVDAADRQQAWTLEQLLRSGSCRAVIGWIEAFGMTTERRLQLAAEAGHAFGFLLYTRNTSRSVAALSLALRYRIDFWQLDILQGKGVGSRHHLRLSR